MSEVVFQEAKDGTRDLAFNLHLVGQKGGQSGSSLRKGSVQEQEKATSQSRRQF